MDWLSYKPVSLIITYLHKIKETMALHHGLMTSLL